MWEEVVQRFEKSNLPMPQNAVEMALFKKAGFELTSGRTTAAIELVNSVLEREGTRLSESKWQGNMIRTRANLVEDNIEACA